MTFIRIHCINLPQKLPSTKSQGQESTKSVRKFYFWDHVHCKKVIHGWKPLTVGKLLK